MERGSGVSINHKHGLRQVLICCTLLLLMSLFNVNSIYADGDEGSLTIESRVGFDGQYYTQSMTPIFVSLRNELGRDLQGDLVLNVMNSDGMTISHVIPVEVSNNNVIDVTFHAEGYFDKNNNSFQFYEGGLDKNKTIKLSGTTFATGKSVNSSDMIGIISSDPDTLNFLLFLNQQDYQLSTVIMDEHTEVESAASLDMFSVLVLNDVATSNWSSQKINSIKSWVKQGGTLVFGGGAGYAETAKAFEDVVPVSAGQLTTIEQTNPIDQYAFSNEPIGNMQVNNGQLVRGNAWLTAQNTAVIASYEYGQGEIFYTAFDLAIKPFSTWEGRTSFVQSMLSDSIIPTSMNGKAVYFDSEQGLIGAISYFPNLKPPSVMMLMLLFTIYAFVIAPILYLILKKADKREWAWWIIPSSAIITTILIIFVGSLDKRENYLHQINVVQDVNDQLSITSMNAIFLASSKDLKVELPAEGITKFVPSGDQNYSATFRANKEYVIKHQGEVDELTWRHNNYWTTRSFVQENNEVDASTYGKLEVEINSADMDSTLIVRNKTGQNLKQVALLNGSYVERIGDMSIDEEKTVTISQPLQFDYYNQYGNSYFHQIFTSSNAYEEFRREYSVLDNSAFFNEGINLVAFSYSNESVTKVNNKKVKTDEMTVWKVRLDDKFMNTISNLQVIKPSVQKDSNTVMSQQSINDFYLESGSISLQFQLKQDTPSTHTFEFSSNGHMFSGQLQTEIYNVATDQWEVYDYTKTSLEGYVNENNMLQMRMSTSGGANGVIPTLFVKGEA